MITAQASSVLRRRRRMALNCNLLIRSDLQPSLLPAHLMTVLLEC